MKINVGTLNPAKIEAVRDTIKDYEMFKGAEVFGFDVKSGVSEQPKTLEETIIGAMNRSKRCFEGGQYGFGIESGLFEVPYTKTGKMDMCICSIWDGHNAHIGMSQGFEFPPAIMKMIKESDIDANEAYFRAGLTPLRKIGSAEGIIGHLTKGRVTRQDYTKAAIQMALIHLENKELYR